MNILVINLLLALIWTFLIGSFTASTLFEGFIVSWLLLWLVSPLYGHSSYFKKFRQVISFLLFFFKELFIASWRVAYVVITPEINTHPGIIAIPLDIKTDAEITLLANLITLTPGTLTLDI